MPTATEIVRTLRRHGHQAFLAGGCVRDRLLNLPVKDEDVATSARPEEVAAMFPGAELVGAHFGVVIVGRTEIATFRSESSYGDGRHPDRVQFETSPERDAMRRDFTINGMFLDPDSGVILDFVGGQEDLRARLVRAIGRPEDRFAEDHLRMLRAVRFAARLGFTIEPATFGAIRSLAPRIHGISPERIRDELTRMLTSGYARQALELLHETRLLNEVLPEVAAFRGVEQPPEFHPEGDVWVHVLMMLDAMGPASTELAWGVLLHDAGKPGTFERRDRIRFHGHVELGVTIARAICTRLRFSHAQTERIVALVDNHMRFMHVREMRSSTLKRFLRMDSFAEHMELHRLDCLASNGKLDNYEFARAQLAAMPPEALRPARLLTGEDLIAAGYPPGAAFREALRAVEDAQLEGTVTSREEAMAVAATILRRPPSP